MTLSKTSSGPITYNGTVYIEVTADSTEKAKEIASAIPGLTFHDDYEPVAMGGGTFIMSGSANNVSGLPDGVALQPKPIHQMN